MYDIANLVPGASLRSALDHILLSTTLGLAGFTAGLYLGRHAVVAF